MAIITVLVTPKSSATCIAAGAIIDDETGDINVKEEITSVAAHFCRCGQLQW